MDHRPSKADILEIENLERRKMKIELLAKAGSKVLDKLGPVGASLTKNKSAIFTGAGIVLLIGGNAFSAWGALKAKKVLEEKMPELDDEVEERKAAIKKGAKVVGYFAPAVASTALGTGFVVHGHRVQGKELAAAMSAYSILSASLEEYRGRVAEKVGEEEEQNLFDGNVKKKIDMVDIPEEGGKPKKHKEEVLVKAKFPNSPYAAMFDDISPDWTRNRSENLYFIRCQEITANRKLQTRGYLFLNEVLDMLGLPYNPAGQFVGWIDEAYEGSKHGHVDFGLSEVYLEDEMEPDRDELGNPEPSLWLDFKVDGEIWDKIPLVKKQMR